MDYENGILQKEAMQMNRVKKPWRANVLAIAAALVVVAVGSMYGSAVVGSEALQTGFQGLGTIAVTGLVAFGKDILTMDANPFDTNEAGHVERMTEIRMVGARTTRQMELEHEFRSADNDLKKAMVGALVDQGGGPAGPAGISA